MELIRDHIRALHDAADAERDEANKYPDGSPERRAHALKSLQLINQVIELEEALNDAENTRSQSQA